MSSAFNLLTFPVSEEILAQEALHLEIMRRLPIMFHPDQLTIRV
jgi:hypothetical protein